MSLCLFQGEQKEEQKGDDLTGGQKEQHVPKDTSDPAPQEQDQRQADQRLTQPPESTFRKLAPSRNRYTILRDEL